MIRNRYIAAVNDKPWWLAGGIPQSACVAAYQAKGASSLAASYTNLANPGLYNATETTASPGWDASTGWYANSVNQGLNTGITPLYDQTWSLICRHASVTPSTRNCALGSYQNSGTYPGLLLGPYWEGDKIGYVNSKSTYVAPALLTGVIAVSGNKGYRNGVLEGTPIGTTASWTAYPISLLASKATASMKNCLNGYLYAAAIYRIVLTDYQVAALTNAMNAL